MNRMRHYHLGCGESLQSGWTELRLLHKSTAEEDVKVRRKTAPRGKQGKRH